MIDKALFLVYNIIVAMSEDITGYMQTYRSGHNGADSKSFQRLSVSSPRKPLLILGFQKFKSNIF